MAFLGDFGKFFGLGSSEEVLGDVGAAIGGFVGDTKGAIVGKQLGEGLGRATSNLAGDRDISLLSTADQATEQSASEVSKKGDTPQETSSSGTTLNLTTGGTSDAAFQFGTSLVKNLFPQLGKFFSGAGGAAVIGTGGALVGGAMMNGGMSKQKMVLTQSRRNKARVRQLVNFVGLEGAASFLSQASGKQVTVGDVVALLLRTFRNDGAYITKAQVRNLRRTTNRFKSLEKQVKEATSMTRTRRAMPRSRSSSTTLIKN